MRIEARNKNEDYNIKYYGDYVIVKQNNLMARSINKIIRIEDAITIELEQVKEKFQAICDLIDMEVRDIFVTRKIMRVIIKCYYGFNQYGTRDIEIN